MMIFYRSSFGVNHLDIGAGYANVLMSISNTFATLPGIISPILTGHLIENKVSLFIMFWSRVESGHDSIYTKER